MTADELQEGFYWISKETYKLSSILNRVEFLNIFSLAVFLANIGLKTKFNNLSRYTKDIMTDNMDI